MKNYFFVLLLTSIINPQNMEGKLEQVVIEFTKSKDSARYFYDSEFSNDEIGEFVKKHNAKIIEGLSSNYYQVYKVSSNLYFFNYKAYGMFALYKDFEIVETEILELIEADNTEYDDNIVQYCLMKFESSLLHDTIAIKRNLIKRFDLSSTALDYSIKSLNYLDKVVDNHQVDSKFIKENLLDLSFYIGAIYINEEGGKWEIKDFQEGLKLPMLISKKRKAINVIRKVYNSFTQEYGNIRNPSSIYKGITKNMFKIE